LPQPGLVSACIRQTGELLEQNRLVTASDLLRSSSLMALKTLSMKTATGHIREGRSQRTGTRDRGSSVADNILGTLFLEHIAYSDSGIEHWLKVSEIVERRYTV